MQEVGKETYKEYLARVITKEIGEVVNQKMEETKKELLAIQYNLTLQQTEEILKNYKKLKEHIELSDIDKKTMIGEIKECYDKDIENLMSEVFANNELYLEGLLKNRYKTIIFLKFIDNILDKYLKEKKDDKIEIRKKKILKDLYMQGKKQAEFIYNNYEVERTFYMDREKLIKDLAPYFFGIRGLNI
ncbi:MAG: hypothetical protein Q4G09_04120 [Clostridia bacterium]|nr:hypothetical protein [Clostridia bacterium]